jgi:hypothetical protein
MIGYSAQYEVAAELIYDSLVAGELQWIRVADPSAGRVDDLQLASPRRLDAYQVKWGEFSGTITFNDLVRPQRTGGSNNAPSLIRQLADGWIRLRTQHADRIVRVHLVSNDYASSNSSASIPVADPIPDHKHFQAFLREAWPANHSTREAEGQFRVPDPWKLAFAALLTESGLNAEEFQWFAEACYFDLGCHLSSRTVAVVRRDEMRRLTDIRQIASLMMRVIGDPERREVEIDRVRLLMLLGWGSRFQPRFSHEFPVDETLYQPITESVIELERSITLTKAGYIALIGTPGSGKSTLLTRTSRYRRGVQLIRYYAFVRDDVRQGRGEAVNFLHDLVLAISDYGCHGGHVSQPEGRSELQAKLSAQLVELHEIWRTKNILTLILVDGLDHVEREQTPQHSLLAELPPPNTVPEGVVFVLGSQKLDLKDLPLGIKAQLETPQRTVTMRPLDRAAIFRVSRTLLSD